MLTVRHSAPAIIGAALAIGSVTARADDAFPQAGGPLAQNTCNTAECQQLAQSTSTEPASPAARDVTPGGPPDGAPVCREVPLSVAQMTDVVTGPGISQAVQIECDVHGRPVSSVIFGSAAAANAWSAAVVAKRAYGTLVPPPPAIQLSPDQDVPQLTGLPVWLYLKPGSWSPVSSSATAGVVSVTATATPVSVTWSMGDGSSVTCAGPGTPYPAAGNENGLAPSPDCGHTFRRTSAGQPAGVFTITATISWRVDWSGGGTSGTFPDLKSSARLPVRVIESAALVTSGRG